MRLTLALVGVVLVAGCGGGSGTFTPATQVADICSLLALSDVQAILPTAMDGATQATLATNDVFSQECDWNDSSATAMAVTLVVEGALTSQGAAEINIVLTADQGSTQHMAVTGLGDRAEYINFSGTSQLLGARVGSYLVEVTAYLFTPDVTEAQLHPLVAKVVGQL
jgi:hypothetical protein